MVDINVVYSYNPNLHLFFNDVIFLQSNTLKGRTVQPMNHQIVWGVLLFLAGIGVFYRTPTVIEKVKTIEYFSGSGIYFAYFCFYFMGIILVGGGIKKIVNNFKGIKKTIQN